MDQDKTISILKLAVNKLRRRLIVLEDRVQVLDGIKLKRPIIQMEKGDQNG